ncbi:MAG: SDR family oxidoreductase [Phycisphaerae bacterium]
MNEPDEDAAPDSPHTDDQGRRVALVTGGASGLGMAVAIELARRGWSIFIQHSSPPAQAAEALAAIQAAAGVHAGPGTAILPSSCPPLAPSHAAGAEAPVELEAAVADISSTAGREQLVEQVLERFERIDMLVNAWSGPAGPARDLLEIDEAEFRTAIDSSLMSTLFLTQRVANEMVRLVETGSIENPKIVTINSLNSYVTSLDSAPRCIGQAALAMVTRLFADRLGEHGINVYEIRAGIIATAPAPGAGAAASGAHARYDSLIAQGLTPIRRWGRPGDVARAVAAIADDLLVFSTGEVINVDGGFHLQRL